MSNDDTSEELSNLLENWCTLNGLDGTSRGQTTQYYTLYNYTTAREKPALCLICCQTRELAIL